MDSTRVPSQALSGLSGRGKSDVSWEQPGSNSPPRAAPSTVRSARRSTPDEAIVALLALPARLLPELPEPVQLRLRVAGAPTPVCFNTGALTIARPVLSDEIEFDAYELKALVLGVEADRIWHPDFLGICFEKWRRPTFQLAAPDALSGANPDPHAQFDLDRVLRRLCAEIVRVDFATPARAKAPAPDHTAHESMEAHGATALWHVAA
jgi:hypothetical protein